MDESHKINKEEKECCEKNCKVDNEPKLICAKCKSCIHPRCTKLPMYILQRFMAHDDSYCCFICKNCVEVPRWREQKFANQKDKEDKDMQNLLEEEQNKVEMLNKEINELKDTVKKKDHDMMELRKKIQTISGNYENKKINQKTQRVER